MRGRFRIRWWILLTPYLLYYGGIGLNMLVVLVNHGTMPVILVPWLDKLYREIHAVMTNQSHLKFLADWIPVYWLPAMWSPGDVLMWLGGLVQDYMIGAWIALLLYRREE